MAKKPSIPYRDTVPARDQLDNECAALFAGAVGKLEAICVNDETVMTEEHGRWAWERFGERYGCQVGDCLYVLNPDAVYWWRMMWSQLERIGYDNVEMIIGPAGSGKTTELKNRLSEMKIEADDLFPCAPTGVACERLRAALRSVNEEFAARVDTPHTRFELADENHQQIGIPAWVSGRKGGFNPATGTTLKEVKAWKPMNTTGRLIYILDEAPNADLRTFALMLLKVRSGKDVRLILSGDVNQLAPVGWGEPVRVLLESGKIPEKNIKRLTKVHRVADGYEGIGNAAADIINGVFPTEGPGFSIKVADGFKDMTERVLGLMRSGYQVLTPTNGLAVLWGSGYAKERYQRRQNKGRVNAGRQVDDKGMFLNRGDLVRIISKGANRSKGILNGCLAIYWGYHPTHGYSEVIPIEPPKNSETKPITGAERELFAMNGLTAPAEVMRYKVYTPSEVQQGFFEKIPNMMEGYESLKKSGLVNLSDCEMDKMFERYFENTQAGACKGLLMHAESITAHRAQGSEWDRVVVVVPGPCRLLNRELFYVAATRAKVDVILMFMTDPKLGEGPMIVAKKQLMTPGLRKPYKIF